MRHVIINDTTIKTLDHVHQFLNKLGTLEFCIESSNARKAGLRPCSSDSAIPSNSEKGIFLDFLPKGSGYSRIQLKPLVQQSHHTEQLHRRQRTAQRLRRLYALDDTRLLAHTMNSTSRSQDRPRRSCVDWPGLALGSPVGISMSYLHVFVMVQLT